MSAAEEEGVERIRKGQRDGVDDVGRGEGGGRAEGRGLRGERRRRRRVRRFLSLAPQPLALSQSPFSQLPLGDERFSPQLRAGQSQLEQILRRGRSGDELFEGRFVRVGGGHQQFDRDRFVVSCDHQDSANARLVDQRRGFGPRV